MIKLLFHGLWLMPTLAIFTPRKAYPWFLAVFAPWLATLFWLLGRPVHSSDDWALMGQAVVMMALLLCAVCFVARAVAEALAARRREHPRSRLDWRPFRISASVTVLMGLLWLLAPLASDLPGAKAAFITAAALGAAALVAAIWLPTAELRFGSALCGACVLALTATSLTFPHRVVAAAEQVADGAPYCLMVADGDGGYRLARSRFDLSPLVMRAPESGSIAASNHAHLHVQGLPLLRWSYRMGRFYSDGGSVRDSLPCRAGAQMLRRLRWT